jgi:hypothetical protein
VLAVACVPAAAVQEQQPLAALLESGHETAKSQNIVYSHTTNNHVDHMSQKLDHTVFGPSFQTFHTVF